MTAIERAAQELQATLDRIQSQQQRYCGPCEKCRHHKWAGISYGVGPDSFQCLHPLISGPQFNTVSGRITQPNRVWCTSARHKRSLCGPDGNLFEPIPPEEVKEEPERFPSTFAIVTIGLIAIAAILAAIQLLTGAVVP